MPHRHRLTIATMATDTPMGAQTYQEQIAVRAQAALQSVGADEWGVRRLAVRSLRSTLPGDRRMPVSAVARGNIRMRRMAGRALYGRDAVTHRMNLELPPSPGADVVTLHDLVAWRFADESPPVSAARQELGHADAVICVSQFTAEEAVSFLGIRAPHVIHNGVDDRFFDAAQLDPAALTRLKLPSNYILHAGGAAARKNLEALAEAWPAVRRERPDLELLLVGPSHPRRTALFDGVPGTVLAGMLPDSVMPGLVAGARAVVVPSLYEGFGLPALEAMAANTPVVAADSSALPEVVGDGGLLVPPTAEGLVDGLLAVTSGDSAVADLVRIGRARADGFSWEKCATEHARVWASFASTPAG